MRSRPIQSAQRSYTGPDVSPVSQSRPGRSTSAQAVITPTGRRPLVHNVATPLALDVSVSLCVYCCEFLTVLIVIVFLF